MPPIMSLTDVVTRSRPLTAHGLASCPSVRTQPLTATGAPSQTSAMPCHARSHTRPQCALPVRARLQHRFGAASAHRGRTSLPCLTPRTQSTNLQVLPRPPSTTCQRVAAAVRCEWQQWHIQQRCQISTHAHARTRAHARAHTHAHTRTP